MTLKVLCVLLHFYIVGIFCFPLDNDQEKYKKPTQPYSFSYGVKDGYRGTDFERSEASDGNTVVGTYSVQLPDGRKQTVKYEADHKKGYVADVSYLGEAQYPPPSKVPPFVVRPHQEKQIENIDNSLHVPRPVAVHSSQLETEEESFDLDNRPRPLPQPVNPHNIPHFKHNVKSLHPNFPDRDLDTEDHGTHVPPFSPHLFNIDDDVTDSERLQGARIIDDVPSPVNFDPVKPFLNQDIIPQIPFNHPQYAVNPFTTQFRIPHTHETFEPNLDFEINHQTLFVGRPDPDISGEFSTRQNQVIIDENRIPKQGEASFAGRHDLASVKYLTEKNEEDFEKNKSHNLNRLMLHNLRGSEFENEEFGKRKFFDRNPSDVGSAANNNLFIPKYIQSGILPAQQNFYQLLTTPYDPKVLTRLPLSFYRNSNLLEPTQIHPKHRKLMTNFLDVASPKPNLHATGSLSTFGLHSSEADDGNHSEPGNRLSPSPIYIPNETHSSIMQAKPHFRLIKRYADNKTSSDTREISSPHEEKPKKKLTS